MALPNDAHREDSRVGLLDPRCGSEESPVETLLMNYCPATGGKSPRWLLRQGHSLGELFVLGAQRRSTPPWRFSSARRSTPCRARRRPSARRTPRGNGTARQASEVGRSDPRAMHACSVTPESPCQHTECSGAELCRNPATGGEPSCHPLAARLVGAVCCRASSAPYKTIKWLDSVVANRVLL